MTFPKWDGMTLPAEIKCSPRPTDSRCMFYTFSRNLYGASSVSPSFIKCCYGISMGSIRFRLVKHSEVTPATLLAFSVSAVDNEPCKTSSDNWLAAANASIGSTASGPVPFLHRDCVPGDQLIAVVSCTFVVHISHYKQVISRPSSVEVYAVIPAFPIQFFLTFAKTPHLCPLIFSSTMFRRHSVFLFHIPELNIFCVRNGELICILNVVVDLVFKENFMLLSFHCERFNRCRLIAPPNRWKHRVKCFLYVLLEYWRDPYMGMVTLWRSNKAHQSVFFKRWSDLADQHSHRIECRLPGKHSCLPRTSGVMRCTTFLIDYGYEAYLAAWGTEEKDRSEPYAVPL